MNWDSSNLLLGSQLPSPKSTPQGSPQSTPKAGQRRIFSETVLLGRLVDPGSPKGPRRIASEKVSLGRAGESETSTQEVVRVYGAYKQDEGDVTSGNAQNVAAARLCVGTAVDYFSKSRYVWFPAKVVGFNQDVGTYKLDVHPSARACNVRLRQSFASRQNAFVASHPNAVPSQNKFPASLRLQAAARANDVANTRLQKADEDIAMLQAKRQELVEAQAAHQKRSVLETNLGAQGVQPAMLPPSATWAKKTALARHRVSNSGTLPWEREFLDRIQLISMQEDLAELPHEIPPEPVIPALNCRPVVQPSPQPSARFTHPDASHAPTNAVRSKEPSPEGEGTLNYLNWAPSFAGAPGGVGYVGRMLNNDRPALRILRSHASPLAAPAPPAGYDTTQCLSARSYAPPGFSTANRLSNARNQQHACVPRRSASAAPFALRSSAHSSRSADAGAPNVTHGDIGATSALVAVASWLGVFDPATVNL